MIPLSPLVKLLFLSIPLFQDEWQDGIVFEIVWNHLSANSIDAESLQFHPDEMCVLYMVFLSLESECKVCMDHISVPYSSFFLF